MILRLIALAVLAFLLYQGIRRALRSLLPPEGPDQYPGSAGSQPVVPCKTCGTFVPRDRALTDEHGHHYCSPQCRERPPG